MKAEFLRWYEAVALPVDPDVVDARLVAVQDVAKSVTHDELEALIRVAFRSKQQTAAMTGAIRAKLAGVDGMLGDEEFRLLAAATLTDVLRADDDLAALAATMVNTAALNGLRTVRQPMDIPGLASATRTALARTTRRRPVLRMPAMPPLTVDPEQAVAADDPNEALALLAAACSDVVKELADRISEFEQQTARYISIQDEELNMLWWLQGGRSYTLGQPFGDIPRDQRPIVLACELAEATFAIPGAASIQSLLARAGVDDLEPLTIAAAVQCLPTKALRDICPIELEAKISPVTTPLHEAFKRRLEVEGDSWIAGWASVCEIDSGTKLSPLHLADLCYCEQLILRK
jgi:hypothetical protein